MAWRWKIFLSVISVALIALIYSIFRYQNKNTDYIQPKVGPITEVIYGLGTVQSENKFSFKVGTTKTLKELFIQEGDSVSKGQKLLRFDDGMIIHSPLTGYVTSAPFNPGENVFQDRPVIEVQDLKNLYLETKLDQQSAMRVKKNLKARINFENLKQKFFPGEVVSIYPSQSQFIAKIKMNEYPAEILPGMTADVAIEVANKESAILIPAKAIHGGQVIVKRQGHTEKLKVTTGIMDQEWAEETSGSVHSDDQILIKK